MNKQPKNAQGNGLTTLFSLLTLCAISSPAYASGKIFLNGKWTEAKAVRQFDAWSTVTNLFSQKPADSTRALAQAFIMENARELSVKPGVKLQISQIQEGSELKTVRMKKSWNGIEVIGGESLVHIAGNEVQFASADATLLDSVSTAAALNAEDAKSLAFASYRGGALSADAPQLKILLLGDEQKEASLVYEVTVNDRDGFSSDIHFIDANTGRELMATTNVHTIKDRRILAAAGSEADFDLNEANWKVVFADKGCAAARPFSAELETAAKKKPKPTGPVSSTPAACNSVDAKVLASARAAWNNSGLVYDYFKTAHNRDSIDGRGMRLNSAVNFGQQFANAAWVNNKSLMIYGMGDGVETNDFAVSLDVAAHELTHGITSRTSGLQYVDESGALNESYSDVFGKIVAFKNGKANDWKLGKELFKDGVSSIRDMENPEVAHYKNYKYKGQPCSRLNDFCGVHSNSGIPNKAAVLLSKKIGLDKLGKIYYLTLTQLLKTGSNFKEARAQTIAACGTLYGAASVDCRAIADAFNAVGIL